MGPLATLLFCTVGLLSLLDGVQSATSLIEISGETPRSFAFLEKFCFDGTGEGRMEIQASIDSSGPNLTSLLFYTSGETGQGTATTVSFEEIYSPEYTCAEKQRVAADRRTIAQGVTYNKVFYPLATVTPHFWYLAAAACGEKVEGSFSIRMTNAGGFWTKELSFDEQGLPQTYCVFSGIYLLGFIFFTIFVVKLRLRGVLHGIVIVFYLSYFSYFVSCVSLMTHFLYYASDGEGIPALQVFGNVMANLSQLAFILGVLVLAKGWAITTSKLSRKRDLAVVLGFLALVFIGIYIYDAMRDRAAVLYLYAGPVGWALLGMRLLCYILFIFNSFGRFLYRTYNFETNVTKKGFFIVFAYGISIYFLIFICLMVAITFLEPWYRLKVAEILRLSVDTFGFLIIPMIVRPRKFYEVYTPTNLKRVRIPTMKVGRKKPSSLFSLWSDAGIYVSKLKALTTTKTQEMSKVQPVAVQSESKTRPPSIQVIEDMPTQSMRHVRVSGEGGSMEASPQGSRRQGF